MSSTTPVVDYTSRDYASLRADLLGLIPQFLPEWTNQSDNDFGVVLLDLFSYVGDTLHYYIDRVANEAYLETASKRSSVLKIASLLGYKPVGNTAATVSITFTNAGASNYTVPAGTVLSTVSTDTSTALTFETDSAILVPTGSTASVQAHHGLTITGESLGGSDGTPNQSFTLFNNPVVEGSISLTVTAAGVPVVWTAIPHLIDAGPRDLVFEVSTDANGVVSVQFGDDVNGAAPNAGSQVTATYRVGGGSIGNVPSNVITVIQTSNVPGSITCNNQTAAISGADAETTDEIRRNAPASVQGLKRATAINDYALLAVTVPGVARAYAVSASLTSVLVYIAPTGGGGVANDGSPLAALTTLKNTVQTFLQAAAPATVSVTVLGPTYVPIDIDVTVNLLPSYTQSGVTTSTVTALQNLLSFDDVVFADLLTPTDVHLALGQVPGVAYVTLNTIARHSGTGTAPVSLAANEIPVVGTLTTTMAGGIVA
jgi:uncharacterized phage protein gp47/JayE